MITVYRIFKQGIINFFRNGVLSFASTTVMVLTLLSLSMFFAVTLTLTAGIKEFRNKIDISVFIRDEASNSEILELQQAIAKLDNVEKVNYISKEDALKIFTEQHKNDASVTDSLKIVDNPLPASLGVKVNDTSKLNQLDELIKSSEDYNKIVESVSYLENKSTIDGLFKATDVIRNIGIVASIVFGIVTIVIVFNTIRIAIFSQKDDIEIMKLVGATQWYIRGPFIIEGVLYGVAATLVATPILLSVIYYYGIPMIRDYFGNEGISVANYLGNNMVMVVALQLVVGLAISIISSWLAMRKYLRF
jgi:cell division transport system permease protein